jgi:hypothetical protein
MAVRQIVKKRVGPSGIEIDCEEDRSPRVDFKDHKKAWYERGRGEHYQKTVYAHCPTSTRREYEEPEKITFVNPNDESQTIPYTRDKGPNHGVIKRWWTEAGRGEHYQRTRLEYCNGEDNATRRVRVQTVGGADGIEVERIERFSLAHGRGESYQKKYVVPCSTEAQLDAMDGPCKTPGGDAE